jgi:hypothetical protein
MYGFVASVFYPFRREDKSWSIVQWTEGEEIEGVAIFEVDVRTNFCNWIIHRGIRESGWKEASIMWNVTDIGRLKSLFHAAQHLSGILEWSTADSHKIYCEGNFANCSPEEYVPHSLRVADASATRYAQLLIRHLSKIEQVEQTFDRMAPALESCSSRQGMFFLVAHLIVVYQHGGYQVGELTGYISFPR